MALARRSASATPWWQRLVAACVCAVGLQVLPAAAAPLNFASSGLTAFRTCTLTVRGSSAVEGIDAQVDNDKPTTNTNTSDMNVTSGLLNSRRSYVRFDLSACTPQIPASATITSAVVRLYVSSRPSLCRTHDIYRVTSTWTETGITWNTQPAGWTALNSPPTANRTSSLNVGPSGCQNAANAYVSGWDVTPDVAAFLSGTSNFGWMIRDDAEGAAVTQTANYKTKNANNASQSPQLIVDYVL